jgi:hypothetical protein
LHWLAGLNTGEKTNLSASQDRGCLGISKRCVLTHSNLPFGERLPFGVPVGIDNERWPSDREPNEAVKQVAWIPGPGTPPLT